MKINIREAEEKDLPFIIEIYNKNILETTFSFRYKAVNLAERKKWLDNQKKKKFPVLVAEKESNLQGFAFLSSFRRGEGYQHTAEESVYVDEKFQKQGVAKILLKDLIQRARKIGIHNLIAGVGSSNIASHKLHLSLGFQECGKLPQVGKKFGKWLDVIFYSLIISHKK